MRRRLRGLARAACAGATLALGLVAAPPALADTPFGLTCGPNGDLTVCNTGSTDRVKTFDGVPIDLTIALPSGAATSLPLVVVSHGWGGHKAEFPDKGVGTLQPWAEHGYAALGISARGFGESCGSARSRMDDPQGCQKGWVHLDDARYELRDIQFLAGKLVDQGIVDPQRIGLTGTSYGGGVSLEGAVLKDRVMNSDGSLSPWTSPNGTPMQVAATAPLWPWSDLVYSLAPNGRTTDFTLTGPTDDIAPSGILKQSYVAGLYALGTATGYYAPPGADPGADLSTWFAEINGGEPYDGNPLIDAQKQEIAQHHSPYYLPDTEAPAPTLLQNGWTDDLFPVDEALRFYNRTRANHPDAPIALIASDHGHARSQNKPADVALRDARVFDWFDRYVKGDTGITPLPSGSVLALTETCGGPSDGPFIAPNWVAQHPGEVRYDSAPAQTFSSVAGDPDIARAIDPIAGGGACASTRGSDEQGTANWRLPAATGNGYTLLGAPTVIADLAVTGPFPEVAARLWDVGPDGTQTLVARALYRPGGSGQQVFQLHPGAWHFAAGHVPKLQLLGRDAPYARVSNAPFSISVSNLELRLPVHDAPDSGQVLTPLPPPVGCGAALAPDVASPPGCASSNTVANAGGGAGGGAGGSSALRAVGAGDRTRPTLAGLAFSRYSFPAAGRGASVARRTGTTVSYRISEPASVRFTVERPAAGRRVGTRCVRPTLGNRTRRGCVRWLALRGSFRQAGSAGSNRLHFTGRLAGRKLRPGRYRLVAVATDAAGNRSAPRRRGFRIAP